MSQLVFGHHVHIHAQTFVMAMDLAQALQGRVRMAFYTDTEAQLRAGIESGRQHLLLQGSAQWVERLFTVPRSPRLLSVVALLTPGHDAPARARLLRAGVDACLSNLASPAEIVSTFEALVRLKYARRASRDARATFGEIVRRLETPTAVSLRRAGMAQIPAKQVKFPDWCLQQRGMSRFLLPPHSDVLVALTMAEWMVLIGLSRSPTLSLDGAQLYALVWPDEKQRMRHLKQKSIGKLISRLRSKVRELGVELPIRADRSDGFAFLHGLIYRPDAR